MLFVCTRRSVTQSTSIITYTMVHSNYIQLHIIIHDCVCQQMITWKELPCVTLCGRVSHIHIQHGHMCPHITINSTYKAKIIIASQVA